MIGTIKRLLVRAGVFGVLMGFFEFYIKPLLHLQSYYEDVFAFFAVFIVAYVFSGLISRRV